MSPYKIEITWQYDDRYMIKVFTSTNQEMACFDHIRKDGIPDVLSKYLCVGNYSA